MKERAYTVREIDAMREAIRWDFPSVLYQPEQRSRGIEERIRTYMIGGVDPQEVIDACQERLLQRQEMYANMDRARFSCAITESNGQPQEAKHEDK